MQVFVNFDLILLAIFITIFITGYIRGGGIELLRVLKVIIPFLVLYFFGDKITAFLFTNINIVDFVYKILPNIPYKNTISILSTHIAVYILVYIFLTIFLWRLGKYVLDERIEYIFGRFNSIFGGIFSLIRMYIIVSILILPFYAFNYTNQEDHMTNLILNNPPMFSKIGRMIETSKPTIDKLNEVSATLKIMDLNSLQKYSALITDVKGFLETNEDNAYLIYSYLYENEILSEIFETKPAFLNYYVRNLKYFKDVKIDQDEIEKLNDDLHKEMDQNAQVVIWAYDHDIKSKESLDEVVDSFINNYPYITANTDDQLTIEVLAKIKLNTQVYLTLKNWLFSSYQISIDENTDLLNDDHLEIILNNYHLYKDNLINDINNIDAKDSDKEQIINQINNLAVFQSEYINVYKHIIESYDQLLINVSFKYKLTFSVIKEKNLKSSIEAKMADDPMYYLVLMDSLEFLNYFTKDDALYFEAAQIYVSLFLIDLEIVNDEPIINQINEEDIDYILLTVENHMDVFTKTNKDVNKMIFTLFNNTNEISYFEYLINEGYVEKEIVNYLFNSEKFIDILDYPNYKLLKEMNERLN
ncbi:MAG: Colicin production protein [Haloplasmataceae bacterium]|jgi:uncharacterized membrane protein required for colicin V production|nr:Colicin production protein [Haloplasmataceae bacterium]